MRGLKGKTAIITGGLGDLGYASGKRLVEEGCGVALFDLRPDTEGMAAKIGAKAYRVDITDDEEVEAGCDRVAAEFGDAAILVNAAAVFIFKGIDATVEEWRCAFDANIAGASLMAKHVVPQMKRVGGGAIVNFSSISGFIAQPEYATYNATKFAVRGLTKCWAMDLGPLNIRVNSVCPGYIDSSIVERYCRDHGLDLQALMKEAAGNTFLNRPGQPDEVAAAVAFLSSDDASFMTGSDLIVDGGYLAK